MPETQLCHPWDKQCNLGRQCGPADFVCMAMKEEELYTYLIGSYCRDPPKCSQKGRVPAELLYDIFVACSQEAAGDPDRFYNCILDMRDLIVESLNKAREMVKR